MKPLALFYHCLLFLGEPPRPLPCAQWIIGEQMAQLSVSGLLAAATEFHAGINGSQESIPVAKGLLPAKAQMTFHGLRVFNENVTLLMLHEWAKTHRGWNVLWFHSKGATKVRSHEIQHASDWRRGMMHDLVLNWRQCIPLLETHDIVCSHWKWNVADGTQSIPAGNCLWINSDFAAKLPSLHLRDRIKQDGIGALSARYEAEVYWGNGPRPKVFQFQPAGHGMP